MGNITQTRQSMKDRCPTPTREPPINELAAFPQGNRRQETRRLNCEDGILLEPGSTTFGEEVQRQGSDSKDENQKSDGHWKSVLK